MTEKELLEMTKQNLQLVMSGYDDYLRQLIKASKEYITQLGIDLDLTSFGDCNLIVMYAAYLYRNRNITTALADATPRANIATITNNAGAMPVMLKRHLNNRLMQQKARDGKARQER